MQRFDTAQLPEAERFGYWREVLTARFLPLDPERRDGDDPFAGALTMGEVGNLPITRIAASGQTVRRSGRLDALPELLFLNLQLGSAFSFEQGSDGRVGTGDLFVIDSREPFTLDCAHRVDQVCVAIPRERIGARLLYPDRAGGTLLRGHEPAAVLLADAIRSGERIATLPGGDGDDGAPVLWSEHVIELLAYALNQHHGAESPSADLFREGLYRSACSAIEREFPDAEFRPGRLAKRLRVSLRLLQRVFNEHGDGIMRRVRARRIALACDLLGDPRHAHKTVTEIALAVGFIDLPHFSRAFSAATGRSPSAWRRAQFASGAPGVAGASGNSITKRAPPVETAS